MIQVWYHANCYDGFGAAWAARFALQKLGYRDITYTPCSYGDPVPPHTTEDDIYIVDFSFPMGDLLKLVQTAKRVRILDHHKTAQDILSGLPFAIFDMERSGAGLTWDELTGGKPRPLLIDLIEDRDLWRFKLRGSKELHAYLCANPFDFDVWDSISMDLEVIPETIFEKGALLLHQKKIEVENICAGAWLTVLDNHQVAMVNTSAHWSEIGHRLLELFPTAVFSVSFTVKQHETTYSLRGRGDFDVSEIAKARGGGGHKSAAGFTKKNIVEGGGE